MTAISGTVRDTVFAGVVPSRGTYGIKANVLIKKGALVCVDSAGRAMPGGLIAAGALAAVGKSSATYDNTGGAADAVDVEVEFGTFGWVSAGGGDAITADDVGKVCYVVDDQTVALTSDTDTRGVAGYITEYRNGEVFVWMGPHVAGQIVIAASEASQLDTAQADIDALQADALTTQAFIPIPIMSWTDNGAPLIVFADGTANGTALVDSEAFGFRFNPVGEDTSVLVTSVPMPPDLDDAADIVLHVMCFRVGASDTTTVLVGNAFFQTVGAAHTADADAITVNSAAIDAATTVLEEVTLTIAGADVPASPSTLTLTLAPSAALDADDLVIVGTWLEYTRKLLTS
jgi:hypothetical protein